nr:uncharacterized protein LOC110076655 [Pogona vitticeps]
MRSIVEMLDIGHKSENHTISDCVAWCFTISLCEEEYKETARSESSPHVIVVESEISVKPKAKERAEEIEEGRAGRIERAREDGMRGRERQLKPLEGAEAGARRKVYREREQIDIFLTTEEGAISRETKKVTAFKESESGGSVRDAQAFSVPVKRFAHDLIEGEAEDCRANKVRPIIPRLSPEEWAVLVYLKKQGPARMVHHVTPEEEKKNIERGGVGPRSLLRDSLRSLQQLSEIGDGKRGENN